MKLKFLKFFIRIPFVRLETMASASKKCNCVCHRASSKDSELCDKCKKLSGENKSRKVPRRQKNRRQRKPNKGKTVNKSIQNPYSRNIHRLLKCIFPDLPISRKAMNVMNSFIMDLLDRIATEASTLVYLSKRSTMMYNDIISATKLVIKSADLCDFAVDAAERVVEWSDNH